MHYASLSLPPEINPAATLAQHSTGIPAASPNPTLFIRQVSMESPHSEALQEEIRQRAHEIYEERGREPGYDEQDWLRAEAEVLARHRVHEVPEMPEAA